MTAATEQRLPLVAGKRVETGNAYAGREGLRYAIEEMTELELLTFNRIGRL